MYSKILFIFCLLILSGCGALKSVADRVETAKEIAEKAGMQPFYFNGEFYDFFGYYRLDDKTKPLIVYIEGDGLSYISYTQISSDPTPVTPTALTLATHDRNANVIWLARPCQYVMEKAQYVMEKATLDRNCHKDIWTKKRFHQSVISDYGKLLDDIYQKNQQRKIHLVGYSGGAAVALLTTAQRLEKQDIVTIRTIAGNINNRDLIAYHDVSPMPESLDPIDIAPMINHIPQIHYVGADDNVVPLFAAKTFQQYANNDDCVYVTVNKTANHIHGWGDFWQQASYYFPTC